MSGDLVDDEVQRWVRERLAAQWRPQLPPEVRARFEAVVVEESRRRQAEPVPVSERRAARPGRWLFGAAAAAAVVVLAGVVVVPGLQRSESTSTTGQAPVAESSAPEAACSVTATAGADLQPVLASTGTTYTAASMPAQARALVTRTPCAATDDLAGYRAARGVSRCVVSVASGHAVLAVDEARYEQQQAVVALINIPPTRAVVLDCATQPARVLYDVMLPQE